MKNIAIIMLMMICLCGCQISQPNSTNTSETKPTIIQDVGQTSTSLRSYPSIDKYSQNIPFLNSLFENFIRYEAFEICGRFDGFVCSNTYSGGKGYTYFLKDKNDFNYSFGVIHGPTFGLDMDDLDAHRDTLDLRFNGDYSGYYYVGKIRYAYFEGKLYNIKWEVDGRTFLIQAADAQLHTYPLGEETFFSRLLNAETAEAAVAEFLARAIQAETAD